MADFINRTEFLKEWTRRDPAIFKNHDSCAAWNALHRNIEEYPAADAVGLATLEGIADSICNECDSQYCPGCGVGKLMARVKEVCSDG